MTYAVNRGRVERGEEGARDKVTNRRKRKGGVD